MQHTQTHSTRLVALTSDTKRTKCTQQTTTVPLPIPTHTLIKIEDGINNNNASTHPHQHASTGSIFEPDKSLQNTMATTVQAPNDLATSNVAAQLFYQHPGLIQIAPQPPMAHQNTSVTPIMTEAEISTPLQLTTTNNTVPEPCISPTPNHDEEQDHDHHHMSMEQPTSCGPEVQDANIQTSPIMSEEENTCGDDMGSSNNLEYDDESQEHISESEKATITDSFEVLCHTNCESEIQTESSDKTQIKEDENENFVDSIVTSSVSIYPVQKHEERIESSNKMEDKYEMERQEEQENAVPESTLKTEEQREPVDLSGLQLLSNSIDVFQKKTIIKQEPMDHCEKLTSPTIASTTETPPIIEPMQEEKHCTTTTYEVRPMIEEKPTPESYNNEELGGLNLLCALAEQRFQEEVGQRNIKESNSPTSNSEEVQNDQSGDDQSDKSRKRKRKHSSSKKSSKKSKHEKDRVKSKKRKHSSSDEHDPEVEREMENTLKRVKTKYENWIPTTPDELFRAMESDMKEKLATITRQCEEKRRELSQIKPDACEKDSSSSSSDKNEDHKPTKISYLGNTAPLKFSIIPALSPSFSSSSNSESISVEIPKLSSDTDSGSKFDDEIERSKRKFGISSKKHGDKHKSDSIVTKKPKSLVGYILASKHSQLAPSTQNQAIPSFDRNGHWTSSLDKNKKIKFSSKMDEDGKSIIKESAFKDERVFSVFGGDKPIIFDKNSQKFTASSPLSINRHSSSSSKHHSKHKKNRSRSKERKHRSEKKKLDARVQLTNEHLSKDSKSRVLTAMGGLFYAGYLSAITIPDIYAITLDGERGNRPHIMSREEIIRDAVSFISVYTIFASYNFFFFNFIKQILEVQPKSTSECPPGTRLCAYWSQQYRCLYPGVAAEPSTPDSEMDEKYVNVEFDDGDSGRIVLEDIRFLLSDYPIVGKYPFEVFDVL